MKGLALLCSEKKEQPVLKRGEEDLTEQQERLSIVRAALMSAFASVEAEAKTLKKRFGNDRDADLTNFFVAVTSVRRAEEAYDLARYDLRTAGGEDG